MKPPAPLSVVGVTLYGVLLAVLAAALRLGDEVSAGRWPGVVVPWWVLTLPVVVALAVALAMRARGFPRGGVLLSLGLPLLALVVGLDVVMARGEPVARPGMAWQVTALPLAGDEALPAGTREVLAFDDEVPAVPGVAVFRGSAQDAAYRARWDGWRQGQALAGGYWPLIAALTAIGLALTVPATLRLHATAWRGPGRPPRPPRPQPAYAVPALPPGWRPPQPRPPGPPPGRPGPPPGWQGPPPGQAGPPPGWRSPPPGQAGPPPGWHGPPPGQAGPSPRWQGRPPPGQAPDPPEPADPQADGDEDIPARWRS